jgi:hypothetical protein
MSLEGVAGAEVDESQDSPSGVRVRLEPDADARIVGVEVQRVLASHGMRSRITGDDGVEPQPDAEPEPPAEVAATVVPEEAAEPLPVPPSVPPAVPLPSLEPPPSVAPEPPSEAPPSIGLESGLASLAVEESAEGVMVIAAATDGRTLTRASGPSEEGLLDAVVSAVGTLADGTSPGLISVVFSDAKDSEVVTVVAERADGSTVAGAAVVRVGRPFAVARATWAALRSD